MSTGRTHSCNCKPINYKISELKLVAIHTITQSAQEKNVHQGYIHAIAKNYVSNITVIQKRRKGDVDATGAKRRLTAPQSSSNSAPKSSSSAPIWEGLRSCCWTERNPNKPTKSSSKIGRGCAPVAGAVTRPRETQTNQN